MMAQHTHHEGHIEEYAAQIAEMRRQIFQLQAINEGIFLEKKIHQFYGQAGEDVIIAHALTGCGIRYRDCTYLDLGANHAKYLSNTYFLYSKGASGVLVEANPNLIPELKTFRPRDQILNRCVSDREEGSIEFCIMNFDGLSTPDRQHAEAVIRENPSATIAQTISVEMITMDMIRKEYFPTAPVLLNVDIEGEEMNILRSIDFDTWRPLIVLLEMIPYRNHLVVGEKNQDILDFMTEHDYVEYAFTGINSIFLDKRQLKAKGLVD